MNKITSQIFIENTLKEFGSRFLSSLRNSGCVVSGSLLTCCYSMKLYKNMDIDIYSPPECQVLIDYILNTIGGIRYVCTDYTDTNMNAIRTEKYVTKFLPINIIYTNCSSVDEICDYISRISDLTICRSTFDGSNLHLDPDLLNGVAHSINAISFDEFRSKYNEDENSRTPENAYSDYMEKRLIRIAKYKSRGFAIDSPKNKDIIKKLRHNEDFSRNVQMKIIERMMRLCHCCEINLRGNVSILYTASVEELAENLSKRIQHFTPYEINQFRDKQKLKLNKKNFRIVLLWSDFYKNWKTENLEILTRWETAIYRNIVNEEKFPTIEELIF